MDIDTSIENKGEMVDKGHTSKRLWVFEGNDDLARFSCKVKVEGFARHVHSGLVSIRPRSSAFWTFNRWSRVNSINTNSHAN